MFSTAVCIRGCVELKHGQNSHGTTPRETRRSVRIYQLFTLRGTQRNTWCVELGHKQTHFNSMGRVKTHGIKLSLLWEGLRECVFSIVTLTYIISHPLLIGWLSFKHLKTSRCSCMVIGWFNLNVFLPSLKLGEGGGNLQMVTTPDVMDNGYINIFWWL